MSYEMITAKTECELDLDQYTGFRAQLPDVTEKIITQCMDTECYTHVDFDPIPSKESVIEIIERMREILFPGYFNKAKLDPVNIKYSMGQAVSTLFDKLSEQIAHSIRHDCFRYEKDCQECNARGGRDALTFLNAIPDLRKRLALDIQATFEGDPAARSCDEIIFSYPGLYTITVYRIAHELNAIGIPLLPRIMTEHAHSVTGIDIHPAAQIGKRFVIDHGTGVVIGETTQIGNNVRIYQGVTLGALSIPSGAAESLKGLKRHPTIEDDVIIYSGATILGGDTIIGKGAVIGGNVWLTQSIPPGTQVMLETPKLIYKNGR